MTETILKKRVLSGMRPTGKLHLGNYMGALKNWVDLQNAVDPATGQSLYECFFFVADIHALTTDYADPSQIKQNTVDVALDFLAAGLNPAKSTIFVQSHVPQHAELHLLFSMLTPLGWLERVPSYKDQQENIKGKDLTTYGFLGYPLLQSADILLYQPDYVPVGADQVAHVELTREVARRFNSLYKTEVFPEPGALLTPTPKLPGTDGRKMSKSYGNTIGLSESPVTVLTKIQAMSTNGQRINQADPGDPDLCPVGDFHKVFSSLHAIEETQAGCRSATITCQYCKGWANISILPLNEGIFQKRQELESKIEQTWEMLIAQGQKAAERAEETLELARAAMNISRGLGSIARRFTSTEEDKQRKRDLSGQPDWWSLPTDLLARELRQYWRRNIIPYDVRLSEEPNKKFASIGRELQEPFLTAKNKRVYVGAPEPDYPKPGWLFLVPMRSYEVWTLLVIHESKWLDDFIIPQKVYAQPFAAFKNRKDVGNTVPVFVFQESSQVFKMRIGSDPGTQQLDISEHKSNYAPL